MASSGNDCDSLEIGNFYVLHAQLWPVGFYAEGLFPKNEGRHGEVLFFGFQDIPGNLNLYITDRAWSDWTNSFVTNVVEHEGIVTFTTPPRGIPGGVAFGMGNNTLVGEDGLSWEDYDVNRTGLNTSQYFELDEEGDQIFLYCVGSDFRDRPIAAFSYGGAFIRNATETTDFGLNTSSAPTEFFEPEPNTTMTAPTPGLVVMRTPVVYGDDVFWNWQFESPSMSMEYHDLRNAFGEARYYVGSNPDGTFSYHSAAQSLKMLPSMILSNVLGMLFLWVWILAT